MILPETAKRPALRFCPRCEQWRERVAGFRERRQVCKRCDTRTKLETRKAKRLQVRAPGQHPAPRPAAEGLFERTLTQLQATWGPYSTWSREQHRQHTALMRAVLGLPVIDDVPAPEVAA